MFSPDGTLISASVAPHWGGGERDKEPRNPVKSVQNTDLGFALSFFFFLFFCSPSAADAHMSLSPSFSGLGKNSSCVCDSLASRPILIYNHAATKMHKKKLGSFLAFISLVYITLQCMGLSSFSLCMGKPGCLQLLCTTCCCSTEPPPPKKKKKKV